MCNNDLREIYRRHGLLKKFFLCGIGLSLYLSQVALAEQVSIITNVDDCANAHTVFYRNQQGLLGVASEVPTTDWPMPEKGDRLQGDFSALGNVLVEYANKTGQVLLNIEAREAPKDALPKLMKQFCSKIP